VASEKGLLLTCDRCGHWEFLKYLGREGLDGGYTQIDRYEDMPDTWLHEQQIGYLCPSCAELFREWIVDFMESENVAWAWKPQRLREKIIAKLEASKSNDTA
jgi:uncharacterized C2H2 Zn-finger protein